MFATQPLGIARPVVPPAIPVEENDRGGWQAGGLTGGEHKVMCGEVGALGEIESGIHDAGKDVIAITADADDAISAHGWMPRAISNGVFIVADLLQP